MTELPIIAFKELQNTHLVPKNLQAKMDLLKACYHADRITRDFRAWCKEHVDDKFKYPITEYLKVIDARLNSLPEEKQPDLKDPHVADLASLAYELTGILPAQKTIATLLLDYPFEEIKGALV